MDDDTPIARNSTVHVDGVVGGVNDYIDSPGAIGAPGERKPHVLIVSHDAPGESQSANERGRMVRELPLNLLFWIIGPPVGETGRRPGELYAPITDSLIRRVTEAWNWHYWEQMTAEREYGGPPWRGK